MHVSFFFSVQCQYDQTSLTNSLQLQHSIFWWLSEPLTHQRAAPWPNTLRQRWGEAWECPHWYVHGKCFQCQPKHLKDHWSGMLECTPLQVSWSYLIIATHLFASFYLFPLHSSSSNTVTAFLSTSENPQVILYSTFFHNSLCPSNSIVSFLTSIGGNQKSCE